ncbi:voltage-dependent anion channel-domain-containing protein [Stachybotrys elegans]|uniref:Voltage-dependent anion channel-domain-containing protein n=1 Tax=Stachybotrys elegans TaxID=80388 RepID=A0A8K0SK39_9HYPO|nr:voltage-dependent anion channel-domain-containing protein [Stachybotrys elegans]
MNSRGDGQHLRQTSATGNNSHTEHGSTSQGTTVDERKTDLEAGTQIHHDRFPRSHTAPLPFRDRAVRVTWGWFPCTMATGGMANLISQQPYTFTGLEVIGKIFFILNLVLFLAFTGLIALRFTMKPRALSTSLHHPSESFYFGAFWVSIALILVGSQAYGGPATGSWFVVAMRVVFWIFYACEIIVAVFQYHVIFESERLDIAEALPSWILPAYPFLVTGLLAGNIAQAQPTWSAVQMVIAGLMGQGLGWMLSLFIYAVYLMRLIQHSLPDPSKRPGMYIAVGPASFTCAGLLNLGKQAKANLPDDFLGITSVPVGDLWLGMSVAAALFLWLMAIWFSALSTLSVIREARHMTFTPSWWAFVFPNVGLALATISVGEALGSSAIQAVASGMTIVLVMVWIFCAFSHVRAVVRRDILAVGKDMDVEKVNEQHEIKKQRRLTMKEKNGKR